MKLAEDQARARLLEHDHGVLCTVHSERGVDAVPVVYATNPAGFVGVPIDRVKPKGSLRLQRERNLERDPRATLLIEHWDRHDWSKLWWVRAELKHADDSGQENQLAETLANRFSQYESQPFSHLLVLSIERVSGWAAI